MSNRARKAVAKGGARAQGERPLLPSVDKVLRSPTGQIVQARFGHTVAVKTIRQVLDGARDAVAAGSCACLEAEPAAQAALRLAEEEDAPAFRRVFNLTGTVLHTNLGRAVLPEAAIEAAVTAMRHAVALEFDLKSGERGERDGPVRELLCELTGAEDACVVNNNAGAVLLTLNTLAEGKDAIVSRGELIEIGGSFRLPDIMKRAGARLVEVGTTNRTHYKDYEHALDSQTGLILKAHTSNYLIQGFTKAVGAGELSALARSRGVPFVNDLGSGALVDLGLYGLRPEPVVATALAEGADIVTFSGDKLLGGPQAGFVAGRKDLVAKIAKNPMKRALRVDKIRLAAIEAVLKLYRDPERLAARLPTLAAFVRPKADIAEACARLLPKLAAALAERYTVRVCDIASQIGSGSLPLETLPSAGLAMAPPARKRAGALLDGLAAAFRALPIPVIGRIKDGAFMLDLRCLDRSDEAAFAEQLSHLRAHMTEAAR